jgi:dephospho-CoA kinase
MLRIGLTGGIACGKSTVAEMLMRRGAHLLSADRLAHQLYEPGSPTHDEIVRRFGPDVLEPDGVINRKRLADVVFPNRIDELNAVVHPAVIEAQNRWMDEIEREDPHSIAVVEAALLLEAGAQKDFDKVIVVICAPAQKAQRYAQRTGVPLPAAQAEVERRSAAQLSDEDKRRRADYVIENSGSVAELEAQVDELWKKLQALAATAG